MIEQNPASVVRDCLGDQLAREADKVSRMDPIIELPADIVAHLFNLNQGKHIDRPCSACGKVTEQVVVSYSEVGQLRKLAVSRFLGRVLDFVPGTGILVGKPTVCRCGRLNM